MNKEHNVNILIVNKKYIFILYAKTVFWWSKKKKKKAKWSYDAGKCGVVEFKFPYFIIKFVERK